MNRIKKLSETFNRVEPDKAAKSPREYYERGYRQALEDAAKATLIEPDTQDAEARRWWILACVSMAQKVRALADLEQSDE